MRALSPHAFEQHQADLLARFDRLGRTTLGTAGKRHRKLTFDVYVPGVPGLADSAHFHYEEWFRRSSKGWLRIRYNYNYRDLVRGGWRGYHLHPLDGHGPEPVPHAKCVEPNGDGAHNHYDAYEVDLRAAHDEFETLYAMDTPIECEGLTSID